MAELFDDRPKRDSFIKDHKSSNSSSAATTPTSTSANDSTTNQQPDETASMEQLEQDLKSILSEISQLGQTSNNERETSWQNKKSAAAAAAALPIMTPSVRLSTAGPITTNASTIGTPKATTTTPVMIVEQPKEKESEPKPVPKFCHSCGASYPERHTVKFCCQCGARRLYVWKNKLKSDEQTTKITTLEICLTPKITNLIQGGEGAKGKGLNNQKNHTHWFIFVLISFLNPFSYTFLLNVLFCVLITTFLVPLFLFSNVYNSFPSSKQQQQSAFYDNRPINE